MNSLRWYLYRQWEQTPWLSLMTWLVLICVIVLAIGFWLPAQQQQGSETVKTRVPETMVMDIEPVSPALQILAEAPRVGQVSQAIETLFSIAGRHQINLQQVGYQDQVRQGEPILHYSIEFTVQSGYPKIKAFVTALLAAMPYLALDQISFERDTINNTQVQAHLRFKLFMDRQHE